MAPEPDHVMRPRVYDELEASARAGLDPCAIAATAANYYWDETLNRLRAKLYDAPFSVRLLCTAIAGPEGGDALRDAAAEACAEFTAALPPGFRTYQNPKASYHSTVFHTANPSDPRPADEAFIAAELQTCAALVAATPALRVEVDRVVLASSGVLLVLLNEQGQGPSPTDDLRVRCRAAFPDAPKKQATFVMHVSLCRVETAPAGGRRRVVRRDAARRQSVCAAEGRQGDAAHDMARPGAADSRLRRPRGRVRGGTHGDGADDAE
jgi:hypothetical protein